LKISENTNSPSCRRIIFSVTPICTSGLRLKVVAHGSYDQRLQLKNTSAGTGKIVWNFGLIYINNYVRSIGGKMAAQRTLQIRPENYLL